MPPRQPYQAQSNAQQSYGSLPVTPPPMNLMNHPTDPVDPAVRQRSVTPPPMPDLMRQRSVAPPPIPEPARQALASDVRNVSDVSNDDFDFEDEPAGLVDLPGPGARAATHGRLPVPEPEAQPSQRPSGDQRPQRPIRRLDQKGFDLPRVNRNPPSGDVIDIPAFLRKR